MVNNIWIILVIIFAYFLGGVNPAYFFGKLKGIDIRKKGEKNAGARNAWKVLGPNYGILTGIFDIFKGFIIIFTIYNFGFPLWTYFAVFLATLFGHQLPFYLKFKGGLGVAVTWGALFAFTFIFKNDIQKLIIFGIGIFTIYFVISRFIILPMRKKLKRLEELKFWRKILRFSTLFFPILYIFFNRGVVLYTLIPVTLIFIFIDIFRLKNKRMLRAVMKTKEKRISGITLLLISFLICVLVFQKEIAILALTFTIIGDNFASFIGSKYSQIQIKLFKKSFESLFLFFATSFFSGLILITLNWIQVSFWLVLLGSASAAIIEIVSTKIIDDNLSVPILSGVIMTLLRII
ncbi:Glycerol-3-phosphate acyltransferase [subsurface metagenome]